MAAFAHERVGRYWPPGREHVDTGYSTLPFPFPRVEPPDLAIEADLDRRAFLDYVRTWSAVDRCRAAEALDPVAELEEALASRWPAHERRLVRWPLSVVAGRVHG
jgi:hypothetical protein